MAGIKARVRDFLGGTVFRHNCILPLASRKRFIFLFHDISPESAPHHHKNYSATPEIFYEQVTAIRGLFDLVSLDALCDPEQDPSSNRAALVFDDGFLSVSTVAAPYLLARGIPFSVFVNKQAIQENRLWCTDVVLGGAERPYVRSLYDRYAEPLGGVSYEQFERAPLDYLVPAEKLADDYEPVTYPAAQSRPRVYMNAEEVQSLGAKGVVVGSHTVSHRLMARLSDQAARFEIEENARFLESLLQRDITHFAFPFGFQGTFDDRVAGIARSRHRCLHSTSRVFFTKQDIELDGMIFPRFGLRSEGRAEILAATNTAFFANRRSQLFA